MIENQENVVLTGMRALIREEMGPLKDEVGALKSEMGLLRGEMHARFDETMKRAGDAYKLAEDGHKLAGDAYKLAQRANVLLEKSTSDIQQVAEAVYNERLLKKRVEEHDDRISSLEWRSEMHEKAIKKVMNG